MLRKIFALIKPKVPPKNVKVLVIEDTDVDRHLTCAMLEKGGYNALKSSDGKSGFELAKEQSPQLIILDYNLPDIKGPELCKQLKAHSDTKHIPVLFLTSMNSPEKIIDCFEQGENYLAKPISAKLLLNHIDRILKNRKTSKLLC